MPNSQRLWNISAPCHLEWWPSRWCESTLWALALLAPFSLWVSHLPRIPALLLALAAFAAGVRSALRYRNSPLHALEIPLGNAAICLDGQPVMQLQIHWRGPLAFLSCIGHNGKEQRLIYWPDTLDPETRRELCLAMLQREMLTPA